ncbi:MAG TPA: Gfo/Idh/MocA family oxidoreductase [Thermomicrobiaceae bacterium]|nr:Gfo/Idh/MocA family oxidoreductase [Thermomicrobiaceae bacterium]
MTVELGIIGAGAIAREHVAAYGRLPGAAVRAVVDHHPERARALAALAGAPRWGTDLALVLDDPEVRAVDICTPPDSHAGLAVAAAGRGKAIHVEKPVTLSVAEFDAMADAASRAGIPLMVGQTARFQPVNLELRRALAEDVVGPLRALHVTWYAGHVWPNGWRGWQLDPARCGGHLVHNGVHALDLAVWLFGDRPVRVFARGFQSFAPAMPTPDSFHIVVRFAGGGMALLEISYALRERGDALRRVVAVGERGTLAHGTEGEPRLASDAARLPSPSLEDAMVAQLRHWLAVVRGEEEPIVRYEEVRETLAAALAAQESFDTGRAVSLAAVARG